MDKRIKKLWMKALRSGKFPQGQGRLCQDGRYCCLGVLEYLASQAGIVSDPVGTDRNYLSDKTVQWAGLANLSSHPYNPNIGNDDKGESVSAGYLNDHGATFTEIADRIEKYL